MPKTTFIKIRSSAETGYLPKKKNDEEKIIFYSACHRKTSDQPLIAFVRV